MNTDISGNTKSISDMTPESIKRYLDRHVVGQDEAKMAMSLACWLHFLRLRLLYKPGKDTSEVLAVPEKSNVLLHGPSGTGKTLIIKTLANILDVPFVHFDASTITAPGHKGEEASKCIIDLYYAAEGNVHDTERGIVFLDEIDKLAFSDEHGRGTKLSKSAQASLLRIIEGTDISVTSLEDKTKEVLINTRDILFVAAGAFSGLAQEQGEKKRSVGFATQPSKEVVRVDDSTPFIKFGLTPELVGRFSYCVSLQPLSRQALFEILVKTESAIIKQYHTVAEDCGLQITFPEYVLDEIVDEAIAQGTGARALKAVFEKRFSKMFFHLPTWKDKTVSLESIPDQLLRGARVCRVRVRERAVHASRQQEECEE